MVRAPLKSKRAPRRRFAAPRRRLGLRRRLATPEWASAKQTLSLPQDAMNIVYRMDNTTLASFDRLSNIAKNYQYYRITKIDIMFQPLMDTYTDSNVQSVPYLHKLLMKGDALDAGTFNKLRDAGAKPIRFDDKTVKVSFRPFVQNATIIQEDNIGNATPGWSQSKVSPWLATSYNPTAQNLTWAPSQVPHKGILYGVEQDNSLETKYYNTTITVHAQFKKPLTFGTAGVQDPGATVKVIRDKGEPAELPPA